MAEVYLAVGRGPGGFNKLVVLKTLRRTLAPDSDMRQAFLAEARLSARLNHPNVVQVYEVVDTTVPYIVMEYLEGQTLSAIQRAAQDRFTCAMQLRVLCEALAGLHYSHELRDYDGTPLNIVHRDISPQNVFVTYDGVVKLLDFGIAKATNAPSSTRMGVIKGKFSYMPREQILCEPIDRRADIHAVGCMLWQAASGAKLWAGMSEGAIVKRLMTGDIPRPSSQRPVDRELESIVMTALAPDPNHRYATALDLQAAIDEYLGTHPGHTLRQIGAFVSELFAEERNERSRGIQSSLTTPSYPPLPELGGSAALEPTRVLTEERLRRRPGRRIWLGITTALLVAVLGAVGYVALRYRWLTKPVEAAASAAAPRSVMISMSVTPRSATLTVDGKPVSGNPAVLEVPADPMDHEVRAVAATYLPALRKIRFDRDLSLEIALEPEAPPPPVTSLSQPAPSVPHRTTAHRPPKPNARCNPPFYFENGIKTFKPECL